MIARLQRRLTLLVIAVLVVVTAGIIASIGIATYRSIDRRSYEALRVLAENRGVRPGRRGTQREQDASATGASPSPTDKSSPRAMRSILRTQSGFADMARLSNFCTIDLAQDGSVTRWRSDRADLYDDEQVQALADAALQRGAETGRDGDQYFRLADADSGQRLIVLDASMERLAAQIFIRTTALVAGLACAILSAAAYLLIRRMVQPVEAAFERQKQFAWDASHEFKTPLAVISANAEALAADIGRNEYLDYIQSEVRRTDHLVQSLLTLARMDRGTITAKMARIDLSKALLGVALPFESTVFEAGRTLETDIPDGVTVRGDADLLQQLAVILLSNALKYSDAHGLIRISLRQKGRGCQLTVYNTGPGIAPEHLEKIFDRFYREDASHSSAVAGNGLGLAIARNIVDVHKGHIRAESTPGRDAAFIVTLP